MSNYDEEIHADPEAPARANLAAVLASTLAATWDNLGIVMAVSFTWTLALSIPLGIGRLLVRAPTGMSVLCVIAATILVLAPVAAGACEIAQRIVADEDVSYWDFLVACCRLARPGWLLGLLNLAVLLIGAVNCWFYFRAPSAIGGAIGLATLYALFSWMMMAVYHFPVLAAQESGLFDEPGRPAKRGPMAAVRRAFFLALGAPVYTLGVLAALLLGTIVLAVTAAPAALFWLGSCAILASTALRAQLLQYGVIKSERIEPPISDAAFRISPERKIESAKMDMSLH